MEVIRVFDDGSFEVEVNNKRFHLKFTDESINDWKEVAKTFENLDDMAIVLSVRINEHNKWSKIFGKPMLPPIHSDRFQNFIKNLK